jgi:putative ABC transport system permease protein
MLKEYFVLSFKNLKHRGIRTWLTLLGIFIGVMAVVALIGLGNGLQSAVSAQFGISSTEIITVQAGGVNFGPPGSGVITPLTTGNLKEIEKINNVDYALRRNVRSGKLEFNGHTVFGMAMNIPSGEKRDFAYEVLDAKALKGDLIEDNDNGEVVLGYNFYADKVGLKKGIQPGDRVLIQDRKFTVAGIIEKKGSFIFDNIVIMNEDDMEDIMNYGDEVDIIAVKLKDKTKMDKTKEEIEKVMRKERGVKEGEEDFDVSTPEAAMSTVNDVLFGVQVFVIIIAMISVFVGAIGIVNTMTTSVVERKKEIGIMKAIGAKNSQVFMQFLVEAGLLGLIGGLVGVTVGTLLSIIGVMGINSFIGSDLKPTIDILLILATLFFSFLIGAVSGVYPAMRAANQSPVEALRG